MALMLFLPKKLANKYHLTENVGPYLHNIDIIQKYHTLDLSSSIDVPIEYHGTCM